VAAPIARDIMVDLLRSQETPPPPATPTPKAAASANPGESP